MRTDAKNEWVDREAPTLKKKSLLTVQNLFCAIVTVVPEERAAERAATSGYLGLESHFHADARSGSDPRSRIG